MLENFEQWFDFHRCLLTLRSIRSNAEKPVVRGRLRRSVRINAVFRDAVAVIVVGSLNFPTSLTSTHTLEEVFAGVCVRVYVCLCYPEYSTRCFPVFEFVSLSQSRFAHKQKPFKTIQCQGFNLIFRKRFVLF